MRALPAASALAAVMMLSGCAGASPAPRVTVSPAVATQAATPSAAAVACGNFQTAITGPLAAALAGARGAYGPHGTLARYAGDFTRWSHSVPLDTTNVQLVNDLSGAALDLLMAGTVPVPMLRAQSLVKAKSAVDSVTSDCLSVR